MERTPSAATAFTATCEHRDRCGWTPATGHVSEDRAVVTMETGFQLTGVLSEDGMEIAWSNNAFWSRLSECGSFGHERLPLDIPGGLEVGSQILCTGVWPRGVPRFSLNLFTADGDNALHVNPRDCDACDANGHATDAHEGPRGSDGGTSRHWVVRNSYIDGQWGEEELDGDLPLRHDVPFQLRVTADPTSFRVTFEGDGSRGQFGGTGTFGLLHEGMQCADRNHAGVIGHDGQTGRNVDQSRQFKDGINEYAPLL